MALSLPETGISKVIGLLEILHDHGNEEETVELSGELGMTLEDLLPVIEAAQLLSLITISGGKMKATPEGIAVVTNATLHGRKEKIRERVLALEIFKKALPVIVSKSAGGKTHKKHLLKLLKAEMPKEKAEKTFKRLVEWGRHAGVIGYHSESEEVFIIPQPKKEPKN